MKKTIAIVALTAAFAVGGAWMLTRTGAPETTTTALGTELIPGAAMAQDAEIDTSTIIEMAQGAEDAPVTLIEYASYTCPHCATFHANQYPQLIADYVDTGKVRFIYREVYFDRFGLWASMVARCGGPERFFGITEMLYDQQRDWIGDGDPAAIAANLRRIGLTAGLDGDQIDACMSDATMAQTLVAWFEENATADEINSTPSLVIDGTKYSNMSFADLSALIDARLAE